MQIVEDTLKFLADFIEKDCQGNLADAARRLGLQYQTLYTWTSGKRKPTLKGLEPVIDRLNISLNFPNTRLLNYEFVPVGTPQLTKDGRVELLPSKHAPWPFEKSWIIDHAIHPASSILVDVQDDIMHPLLRKGDFALVDLADCQIRDGEVYLLSLGPDMALRRLVRTVSGLVIHAEDRLHPDVPVGPQEYAKLTVHGRLRWVGKLY